MDAASPPPAPAAPTGLRGPYAMILFNIVISTAAELLLKVGADAAAAHGGGIFGIAALGSVWTWAGIGCYVVSLLTWLEVLRWMPLSLAFALQSVQYVTIPLARWGMGYEAVDLRRWFAVGLVMGGVILIGLGRRREHGPAVSAAAGVTP